MKKFLFITCLILFGLIISLVESENHKTKIKEIEEIKLTEVIEIVEENLENEEIKSDLNEC